MNASNRDIRNRAIATELLTNPEQTYEQIADKVGLICENPRQTVYSRLQKDSFKRVMNEIAPKYYDEEYLKSKVRTAIEETKPEQPVHGKYLELGMRNLAMLTDKNINENHDYNETEFVRMRQQALNEAIDAVEQGIDRSAPAGETLSTADRQQGSVNSE